MNRYIYTLRRCIQRLKAGLPLDQFVVISRSRTGSNWLISLLNAHPAIKAHGEVFQKVEGKSCKDVYGEMIQSSRGYMQMGFKLFYYHPIAGNDKSIWDMLAANRRIKIIHLTRENLLRVHLSRIIAGNTNEWLAESQSRRSFVDRMVHLDVAHMLSDFGQTRDYIKGARHKFHNHEVLELTYEELAAHQQGVLDAVFNFLRVPVCKVQSRLVRQNPEPISALVSNYAELRQALESTPDEYMLTG